MKRPTVGNGKNPKSAFFLLGLKYAVTTCFESKKSLPKSCSELSNQVFSFSANSFENMAGDPFSTF